MEGFVSNCEKIVRGIKELENLIAMIREGGGGITITAGILISISAFLMSYMSYVESQKANAAVQSLLKNKNEAGPSNPSSTQEALLKEVVEGLHDLLKELKLQRQYLCHCSGSYSSAGGGAGARDGDGGGAGDRGNDDTPNVQ